MHIAYEEIRGHIADFRVKYMFFIGEEGGRLGVFIMKTKY